MTLIIIAARQWKQDLILQYHRKLSLAFQISFSYIYATNNTCLSTTKNRKSTFLSQTKT